jgi:hypothetical protein
MPMTGRVPARILVVLKFVSPSKIMDPRPPPYENCQDCNKVEYKAKFHSSPTHSTDIIRCPYPF